MSKTVSLVVLNSEGSHQHISFVNDVDIKNHSVLSTEEYGRSPMLWITVPKSRTLISVRISKLFIVCLNI